MAALSFNRVYHGDCIEGMKKLADKSVDMILSDLPYGVLECRWDRRLPLDKLFAEYNRVITDNGAIVLTAAMKFAVDLINANRRYFRYDLVWRKNVAVGFANANRQPMRNHELILVFYKKMPVYNPQGLVAVEAPEKVRVKKCRSKDYAYPMRSLNRPYVTKYTNYPRSVLEFPRICNFNLHPTQKPVEMFEYLIRTFTNEGAVVLDSCMGSGTTAVACIRAGRRFVGFEADQYYHELACKRVECWDMAAGELYGKYSNELKQ